MLLWLYGLALSINIAVAANAQRVVVSNDDGWAVAQIRAEYHALRDAGYDVILSAPADNQSGRGSRSKPAVPRMEPCEFNSCPTMSGPTGNNASDTRLNWINAFPVDAATYGINTLAPTFWDGAKPDFLVSGPNVGPNVGLSVFLSGTIGAAGKAVQLGVPAVAFSGISTVQEAWTELSSPSASIAAAKEYAQLTAYFLDAVFSQPEATPRYLPDGIVLNVNLPAMTDTCTVDDVQWVLTRVFPVFLGAPDVQVCGNKGRLPGDKETVGRRCFASVSVIHATSKLDVSKELQADVLERLGGLGFVCLP